MVAHREALLRSRVGISQSRGNIVIVEDDAGLNRAVARSLQIAGFRSSSFATAEALLETDAAEHADCFVLDIHLPGISGPELQRRLSDSGTRRPVIFITAHDDAHTRCRARNAAAYIIKPFSCRALMKIIDEVLREDEQT